MYVEPCVEVIKFEDEDIITTSGTGGGQGGGVVLPDDPDGF